MLHFHHLYRLLPRTLHILLKHRRPIFKAVTLACVRTSSSTFPLWITCRSTNFFRPPSSIPGLLLRRSFYSIIFAPFFIIVTSSFLLASSFLSNNHRVYRTYEWVMTHIAGVILSLSLDSSSSSLKSSISLGSFSLKSTSIGSRFLRTAFFATFLNLVGFYCTSEVRCIAVWVVWMDGRGGDGGGASI